MEFDMLSGREKIQLVSDELEAKSMSDIEIASRFKCQPIFDIAAKLDIPQSDLEPYGRTKAKVSCSQNPKGKLILVTAINPTAAGEGKTTISIGLTDGLALIGKKTCVALREPSLGPVFGVKGGAAGGGLSQVIPMEEINLHFTGDLHAITAANNLLAALIDNHIHQGNLLRIHPKRILWKRCLDLNDRALRSVIVGLGNAGDGVTREDGFNITAASEVMAILCLSSDLEDLKSRLGRIVVGYDYDNNPVYASQLKANNSMAILLKDAIKPNLVQTLLGTPAFIHGGPFANIAHGCNSIIATKTALTYADYVVTEAGFGADLGAEKFINIKCRTGNLTPSAVVIVATVRALKLHGGADKKSLSIEDVAALKRGIPNLIKHIQNITGQFCLPVVVAINQFKTDTTAEINEIVQAVNQLGIKAIPTQAWAKGGFGAMELAKATVDLVENNISPSLNFTYPLSDGLQEKIKAIATKIYGASDVAFSAKAMQEINQITAMGYGSLPIIIAKTQYSLSDNPSLIGRPENFIINIREVQLRCGSGFVVAVAGDVMLMPGLPKVPASDNMTLDGNGVIGGLF